MRSREKSRDKTMSEETWRLSHSAGLWVALATIAVALSSSAGAAPTVQDAEQRIKTAEAELTASKAALGAAKLAEKVAKEKAPPSVETMQLALPRLKQPPKIDGIIEPGEWDAAIAVPSGTGASNQGQPMRARSASVYFLGWDPEFIYVAQRLPLREGEQPRRLNRKPQQDAVDPWETVVEFYIDRKGNGSHGLPARYQFMGNAVGNRWDVESQYSIGITMYDWNGDWQYTQRVTPDGKFWETEMAIPRKTVYAKEPLKDGDSWNVGFAASLQDPWQWSGFYGYPVAATFRDETPVVRLSHPERGVLSKRMSFDAEVVNTTTQPLKAELVARLWDPKAPATNQIVLEKRIPVSLAAGERFAQTIDEDAAAAVDRKTYRYTVMLLQGDRSLYTWNLGMAFNDPENTVGLKVETKKEPFPLKPTYYPLANMLKVTVDKYDLANRDAVASVGFEILPPGGGKSVATGNISQFDHEEGFASLALPAALAPGVYTCKAIMRDAAGKTLAEHSKTFERKDHTKDFPWMGNTIGLEDKVPRNFAPVTVEEGVIKGYLKEIRLDGGALPASVRARGEELLAGPIHLRGAAAGVPFTTTPSQKKARQNEVKPTRAAFAGSSAGGGLKADAAYALDYDGTARIELTVAPAKAGQPVKLDSLQLVIPFRAEAATHYMVNGYNMRVSNRAGRLPGDGKPGVLWKSTEMKAQKMTVGSFIPIAHLGNLNAGLTWFADSDKGWWPSDKRAAIEIVRATNGTIELVCNLAAEPVTLDAPRTLVFGLCTVPVRAVTPYRTTAHTIGFGHEEPSGRWDPKKTPGRVYARVYPDDPAKFRAWVDGVHASGGLEKAYVENSPADYWENEFNYFAADWASPFSRSAADNKLYWTDKFIRDTGLDGYYFDNIFNRLHFDTVSTSAYLLPDGRVQPGYDLWDCRDYFRRIRLTFEKYRDPTAIVFHNTDFQFAPVMGYADLVMGGENPLPATGTPDFMDMWPRDWMDVTFNPTLWGYSLSHLYHKPPIKNQYGEVDHDLSMKSHRTVMASMLVHGVEFWGGIEYKSFLAARFSMFKALPGELEFIPSWRANGRFAVVGNDPDIDVALWRKPGALLIIVANYGKTAKQPTVQVDFPALIQPPAKYEVRSIVDWETMEFPGYIVNTDVPNGGHVNQSLKAAKLTRLAVAPRDFRVYLLSNEPVSQGAGF
jgi:hypothetical protein